MKRIVLSVLLCGLVACSEEERTVQVETEGLEAFVEFKGENEARAKEIAASKAALPARIAKLEKQIAEYPVRIEASKKAAARQGREYVPSGSAKRSQEYRIEKLAKLKKELSE